MRLSVRRWRSVAALGATATLLLTVAALFWGGVLSPAGDEDRSQSPAPSGVEGLPDRETVALPPLSEDDAQATRAFLAGAGQPLLAFHQASSVLLDLAWDDPEASRASCREVAEGPFAEIAPTPAHLLALAALVPDEGTLRLLVNDVAAKRELLAACGAGQQPAAAMSQAEARFTHALLARRLQQVEVDAAENPGAGTRGSMTLTVAERVIPSAEEPADPLQAGPVSLAWLATGDSYSSGEGLLDAEGQCQQSDAAYAPLVRDLLDRGGWGVGPWEFSACTGYLVGNFYNATSYPDEDCRDEDEPVPEDGAGSLFEQAFPATAYEDVQLSLIRAYEDVQLSLITFSLGGNDLCFAEVAKDCLGFDPLWWVVPVRFPWDKCGVTYEELVARVDRLTDPDRFLIDEQEPCPGDDNGRGSLADFYACIYDRHLAASDGHLVVMGYPHLFADSDDWPEGDTMCYGVKDVDADMLSRVGDRLDTVISDQLDAADAGRNRIHYLPTSEGFSGHELCGPEEPWINGLGALAYPCPSGQRASRLLLHFGVTGVCHRLERPLHPNEAGHRAEADWLYELLQTFDWTEPTTPTPTPAPTPTPMPTTTPGATPTAPPGATPAPPPGSTPTPTPAAIGPPPGPTDVGVRAVPDPRCDPPDPECYLWEVYWTPADDTHDGFRVYVARDPDDPPTGQGCLAHKFELVAIVPASQTSYLDPPPDELGGGYWCYAVSAFNSAGESPLVEATGA